MSPTPQEADPTSQTSPELVEQFKEILKSNGIIDPVSEISIKGSGLQGENMAGLTNYITVTFNNPAKKPLHLFSKSKTNNPTYDKLLEDIQVYQTESTFFMKYLPKAREFCKSLGQEKLMDIYPKCYYGDDKMIVLENLVLDRGFILLNKHELQDFETARFALTSLAKHNAISYAFIRASGGPDQFFQSYPKLNCVDLMTSDTAKDMLDPMFESAIDTSITILEKCQTDGSSDAIDKLKSWKGTTFNEVVENLKTQPNDFLVLNHGDYWNNNMMFLKDKETNRIVQHVAIDFQGVRYSSPCVDLAYYFFTSVKDHVRRERFRELLTVYLDVLKLTANELGSPIELTLDELEADYCKRFNFGFWMGLALTQGAGFEVMKDFDITENLTMDQMNEVWDRLIAKWIDEHPEECKVKAKSIIEYVKDYDKFSKATQIQN